MTLLVAALGLLVTGMLQSPEVTVELEGVGLIKVVGIEHPDLAKVTVWTGGANPQTDPPILGKTHRNESGLTFKPRFPFRKNTTLTVAVQLDSESKPAYFPLSTPVVNEKTRVEAIFPSADVLPENVLKFYVHFSSPMRKGEVYDFISIREVGGAEVELPFLEIEQELWSRDSKRLTLLLDPGRIKRGLKPRLEMGAIFVVGKSYELVIDRAWPNAFGVKLENNHVKRFKVKEEDRTKPNPNSWDIEVPKPNSRDLLSLRFEEPLDHPMLQRCLLVLDSSGQQVAGKSTVFDNEKRWSFSPDAPWNQEIHRIVIDRNLEDNAGNSVGQQFDVDVSQIAEQRSARTYELEFDCR